MNLKDLSITIAAISVISVIAVVLFQLPALLPILNLTDPKSVSIATAISGFTAPVLNAVTIFFVWQTFKAQKKTNDEQYAKNEQDLILLLIQQMMVDFDNITITIKPEKNGEVIYIQEKKSTGAVIKFCREVAFQKHNAYGYFRDQGTGDDILYLIKSFEIISNRIADSTLETNAKTILNQKMQVFFNLKLEPSLKMLVDKFINENDVYAVSIRNFYNKYESTMNSI